MTILDIFRSPWDISGIFVLVFYALVVRRLRKTHTDVIKSLGYPDHAYTGSHSSHETAVFLLAFKWLGIRDPKLWVLCMAWYLSLVCALFALVLHTFG